jgi:hypothetical protein
VLSHLAVAGPLTVGEAAVHLGRAQSVVSEIVDALAEALGRMPADARAHLLDGAAALLAAAPANGEDTL